MAGNLYIADTGNNCVRSLDAGGTITTIAGTGVGGFIGNGGPAYAATLSAPQGLALGDDGRPYITDTGNNRVRRHLVGGTMTTRLKIPRGLRLRGGGLQPYCNGCGRTTSASPPTRRKAARLVHGAGAIEEHLCETRPGNLVGKIRSLAGGGRRTTCRSSAVGSLIAEQFRQQLTVSPG